MKNSKKCEHGRDICPCGLTSKKINKKIIDLIMFDESIKLNSFQRLQNINLCYWLSPDGVMYHINYGSHELFFESFIAHRNNREGWIKLAGGQAYLHENAKSITKKQRESLFSFSSELGLLIEDLFISDFTWYCKDYD